MDSLENTWKLLSFLKDVFPEGVLYHQVPASEAELGLPLITAIVMKVAFFFLQPKSYIPACGNTKELVFFSDYLTQFPVTTVIQRQASSHSWEMALGKYFWCRECDLLITGFLCAFKFWCKMKLKNPFVKFRCSFRLCAWCLCFSKIFWHMLVSSD